jgi:surface polysaccharide O-acyltransferase-like enzyme
MKKVKTRNITLDIIRLVALFFVISVHFFMNSKFYTVKVSGIKMLIMIIFQSLFLVCVPLFLILTGYLQNKKKLEKKYYKGIIKILLVYLIMSIIYSVFIKLFVNKPMNIKMFILNLLKFKGTDYAWYIEMYIGLFLLIPFLNIIFNKLSEKENKYLLLTLIGLVCIPSVLNIYRFDSITWFKQPCISNKYVKLVPSFWTGIYPILYYYLGAYLSKYKLNISIKKNILYIVILTILFGCFNFYRSWGHTYIFSSWNRYSSLFIFILGLLIFNLLLNIKINKPSKRVEYIFKLTTDSVLGAYLISNMFDRVVYKVLNEHVSNILNRWMYAPLAIIVVFICSLGLSICVELIYRLIKNKKFD